MNFYARRFNLYLPALLALMLAGGCSTFKKDKSEPLGTIHIHVQSSANLPDQIKTVSVVRASPVLLTISPQPFLSEANLLAARLIEAEGGFAIQLKFDETGGWMLEQTLAANPGKHLVIFGQWGDTPDDARWLAAPIITGRIANGILTFTPDMSHDEAQQFVDRLNNSAKKFQTDSSK
ncbi:MAG TPA: hypothetical protein VIK53_05845 [Verrucomicrobiae bacterium]